MGGNFPDEGCQCFSFLSCSRNVEEYKFIRPLFTIPHGQFDGVARIPEFKEIGSFHGAAVFNIQAGNNPFSEHIIKNV